MKKNLILPVVLFCTVMIFGIGKSISLFSDSINVDSSQKESNIKTERKLVRNLKKLIEATPASVTWPLIENVTTKYPEGNLESSLTYPATILKTEVNSKVDFTGDGNLDSNIDFFQFTGTNTNSWTGTGSNSVIDETKYVQIDVNATNSGTFTINRVEAMVGGAGTSNMY